MPPISSERLKLVMKLTETTPADLARTTGLTPAYISQLRSGRRTAERNVEHRNAIARALGVPRDWIEEGMEPTSPVVIKPGDQHPNPNMRLSGNLLAEKYGASLRTTSKRLGVDPAVLSRGLSVYQADKYSIELGFVHPSEVWGMDYMYLARQGSEDLE